MELYGKRISRYLPFEEVALSGPRLQLQSASNVLKEKEGEKILEILPRYDFPVLLDAKGILMDSEGFARFVQQAMNRGTRYLAFFTGGAFGFSDSVYARVTERISLSAMTFSHELARLVFAEQLYRAMTIIRGEPYHHV